MHDVLLKPSAIRVGGRLICLTAAVSEVVEIVVDKCMSPHSIRLIKEVPAEGLKTTAILDAASLAAATAKDAQLTLSILQTLTQAFFLGCIYTECGKVWPVVSPLIAQALSRTVLDIIVSFEQLLYLRNIKLIFL